MLLCDPLLCKFKNNILDILCGTFEIIIGESHAALFCYKLLAWQFAKKPLCCGFFLMQAIRCSEHIWSRSTILMPSSNNFLPTRCCCYKTENHFSPYQRPYQRRATSSIWTYFERILNFVWTSFERRLNVVWASFERILNVVRSTFKWRSHFTLATFERHLKAFESIYLIKKKFRFRTMFF